MERDPTGRARMRSPLLLALLTVLVASAAGQAAGAAHGSVELSIFAATAFVGAMLRVAWQANHPWWHCADAHDIGPAPDRAQPMLAARNAVLLAIGYAWGAASLAAVYLGTPLRWQHGWQYASGMALIALLIALASRRIEPNWSGDLRRRLVWVSLLHGWAATGGLVWLIGSGKIFAPKPDWAANIVFAGGAVIVACVGAMWLRTNRLLSERTTQCAPGEQA